jgi:hypothetical protein
MMRIDSGFRRQIKPKNKIVTVTLYNVAKRSGFLGGDL